MSRNATTRAALDFVRLIATMDRTDEQPAEPRAGASIDDLINTARALALAEHREIDPHCVCPDCVRFHFGD